MDARGRLRGPVRAAIAFDVAAVAILVAAVVVAVSTTLVLAVPVAILDVVVAPAAAVLSGVVLRRSARRRATRVAATVATVVLTVATIPVGFLAFVASEPLAQRWGPNPARIDAERLGGEVEAAGGARVCGSGDPGLGPDNVAPWYDALYRVDVHEDIRPRLERRARALGLAVVAATDAPGTKGQVAIIAGPGAAQDPCGTFDHRVQAPPGQQLVDIRVALPQR